MTAIEVLGLLADRGIGVHVRDGQLRLRGPSSVLTEDVRRLVGGHRVRLLAHLSGSTCIVCGQPCHPAFNPHPACGVEGQEGEA